jgi:hypothetical protein
VRKACPYRWQAELPSQLSAAAVYLPSRDDDAAGVAPRFRPTYSRKEVGMRILNIVTSPRKERSVSIAIIDSFLFAYQERIKGLVVDTLDVWTESLPDFGAEAIGAKYKGVSGEAMTPSETATWGKIRELASRFQKADRIVLGIPMWNFPFLIN